MTKHNNPTNHPSPEKQKRKIQFKEGDRALVLKNQIITWILTVNSEMDAFVSNLANLTNEEKSKKLTQFYSTLLVINKALDGRVHFHGNQILSRDFDIEEEVH